jgi:hypothetical protein
VRVSSAGLGSWAVREVFAGVLCEGGVVDDLEDVLAEQFHVVDGDLVDDGFGGAAFGLALGSGGRPRPLSRESFGVEAVEGWGFEAGGGEVVAELAAVVDFVFDEAEEEHAPCGCLDAAEGANRGIEVGADELGDGLLGGPKEELEQVRAVGAWREFVAAVASGAARDGAGVHDAGVGDVGDELAGGEFAGRRAEGERLISEALGSFVGAGVDAADVGDEIVVGHRISVAGTPGTQTGRNSW